MLLSTIQLLGLLYEPSYCYNDSTIPAQYNTRSRTMYAYVPNLGAFSYITFSAETKVF